WLLVVGCWLLVVGCWLLVVGCWLLVGKAKGALQQETNQYQGGGMRYRRNYVDSKSSNRILFFHFTTQNHIPPAPPKRYKIFNGSLEKYSIIASILDSQFCA
ncbi:hypothetical protein, partial [Balneatrix alpica]